jgi:excinuclease ABC subunit B
VNLLREGLDLPEVSLVAILDADKEGFLRNHRSLTQTSGRAARNVNGRVIMYADKITNSMQMTIDETNRRREIQIKYNSDNNLKPQPLNKKINKLNSAAEQFELNPYERKPLEIMAAEDRAAYQKLSPDDLDKKLAELQKKMEKAAQSLDFIEAARIRDIIQELKG